MEKTRGIVFRTHKYGETSLIVEIYTETKGLRKYIISGVRSPQARTKANLLQLMSLVDIVAYDRDDKDLNRLKEVRPACLYQTIPFNLRKGTVGLFMTEVARKAIREREANPVLFQFLFERYRFLDLTDQSVANYHLSFLVELATLLGFAPAGEWTEATPLFDLREGEFTGNPPGHNDYLVEEQALLLHQLLESSAAHSHQIVMTRDDRRRLVDQLIHYYRLHLEGMGEVHSHLVLHEVF